MDASVANAASSTLLIVEVDILMLLAHFQSLTADEIVEELDHLNQQRVRVGVAEWWRAAVRLMRYDRREVLQILGVIAGEDNSISERMTKLVREISADGAVPALYELTDAGRVALRDGLAARRRGRR